MTTTAVRRRSIPKGAGALAAVLAAVLAVPPAAVAEASEAHGWSAVESAHFTVYTDADPGRGAEIATALERFRAVFARLAPALELRSPAPTRLLAFRDAESYAPFRAGSAGAGARILGQFLPHPDGNFITLDADPSYVGAYAVVFHEYVHYLVTHNLPGVPLWLNEGLAEYYSTFAVEDGRAWIGRPVERHLRWLAENPDFSLAEVLATTAGEPAHGAESAGTFYAVSWLLTHHLLSGSAERLDRAADYLTRLAAREDPERAFEAAFDTRPSMLEAELRRYLEAGELPVAGLDVARLAAPEAVRLRRPSAPEVASHQADLLVRLGRRDAAVELYHQALALDPGAADALAGLAHVLGLEGRSEEAELLFRDALSLGSPSARSRVLYARHLLSKGGSPSDLARAAERAREVLPGAIELEPSFAEALGLFGYAHLFGAADSAPGVRALERARGLAPGRVDLIYHQVRLHLAQRELERAGALVEGALAFRAEPELLERARGEVERTALLVAAEEAFAAGDAERGLELFDAAIEATRDRAQQEAMEATLRALQERHRAR